MATPFAASAPPASPDQQFEQGFFQLAYDKLQSRLFNLLPYLIGFEVIRKEPDGTRAVGVFGFRSDNGHVLFVPAFFINGTVRELDVLYSKNNRQFYPLNEDFAQLFLRDDPTGMGRLSSETRQELERSRPSPDTRDMSFPPAYGRTVHASVTLPEFLQAGGNRVKQAMTGLLRASPAFTSTVLRLHPMDKLASALVPEKSGPADHPAVEVLAPKAAPADLKVKAVRDGYVVIDRRTSDQKSRFGEVQAQTRFSSVTSPGFHTYLTDNGTTRHGLVLVPQELTTSFNTSRALVVDLQSGTPPTVHQVDSLGDVITAARHEIKGFAKVHSRLTNPVDVRPGYEEWLLVDKDLNCAGPFEVVLNYLDARRIRRLVVRRCAFHPNARHEDRHQHSSNAAEDRWPRTNLYEEKSQDQHRITLVFSKEDEGPLRRSGRLVVVPRGWRLLRLNRYGCGPCPAVCATDPSDGQTESNICREQEDKERREAGRPGRMVHLTSLMRQQKLADFQLRKDASGLSAVSQGETRRYDTELAAKVGMIMDFGFDDEDARRLVERAGRDGRVSGCIKQAVTGNYSAVYRDEPPSYNELGQPTTFGIPYEEVVPHDPSYSGDPTALGLGVTDPNAASQGMPSLQDVRQAANLASSHQREVFDTGTIAMLAKYVDPASKVVTYLPSFTTTLDRLGRMLFMLNWDMEKFQKMYGPDELPELQELLTNVFRNLGDLVIFLTRKFPDLSINRSSQAPPE